MRSEYVAIDPTLPFEEIEAQDRRRVVGEHARSSVIAFFVAVVYVGAVEWITRPSHRPAVVLVGALYVSIVGACLASLRLRPRWAVPIAVGGVSALCAAMLSYSPLVHGSGELCVLATGVLLGGFAVMFPVGVRNQLLASIVPLVGYVIVLQLGTTTAYPAWYSGSALVVLLFVFAVGARSIDRYRSRILSDVFHQAELAAENARLRDEASAANLAKSELMSILAHELRTPLGTIRNFSYILLEYPNTDADELRECLQGISDQSLHALDLVKTMLEHGSIASGRLQVSIAEFNVAELIDRIRDRLPLGWCRPDVQLLWYTPPTSLLMRTDQGKVEAILRNLVHNALRHTTAGCVTVTVSQDTTQKAVRFVVTDTGEGISQEALPQIFDSFARATSAGEGFGLGLFIVKRFTEILGGKVSVTSTRGRGARFEAVVPLDAPVPASQRAEVRAA